MSDTEEVFQDFQQNDFLDEPGPIGVGKDPFPGVAGQDDESSASPSPRPRVPASPRPSSSPSLPGQTGPLEPGVTVNNSLNQQSREMETAVEDELWRAQEKLRDLERQLKDVKSTLPQDESDESANICTGKANAAWSSSTPNTITLTDDDSGQTVTCEILSPSTVTPANVAIAANDDLAYWPDPSDNTHGYLMPTQNGGGGAQVSWGKATAAWSSSTPNQIVLQPWSAQSGGSATGAANVTCTILSPSTNSPAGVNISSGDILAYLPLTSTTGILLPVPSTSPAPTAQYQVLQCTSYTNSTTYVVGFDWVRAHA